VRAGVAADGVPGPIPAAISRIAAVFDSSAEPAILRGSPLRLYPEGTTMIRIALSLALASVSGLALACPDGQSASDAKASAAYKQALAQPQPQMTPAPAQPKVKVVKPAEKTDASTAAAVPKKASGG
jgi:hypothetical protein